MAQQQYNKGDYVIYGTNGICYIDDIKPLDFFHDKRIYYIMKLASGTNSTLYLPVDSDSVDTKMRYILSKEEIDALLNSAKGKQTAWIDDKNARASTFYSTLSGGIHEELILMIRCIYLRRQQLIAAGKKLSGSDDNILQSAERIVKEEFAFALGISPDSVGDYIRKRLDISAE